MRVLFTGKGGKAGSWAVRGEQLGAAMGATVAPLASQAIIEQHDIAVVVKRTPDNLICDLRLGGVPWVWDVVDDYHQPCSWNRREAIRWMRAKLDNVEPAAVIWPTHHMRQDCDDGRPGLVLPHHYRPGIAPNPVREQVRLVGYEGCPDYLGGWLPILERLCRDRGWRFVVNPPSLAEVDIVVAFRGRGHCGYVQKHFKSNVKSANAQGSGTPCILAYEAGYMECNSGGEVFADDEIGISEAMDYLTPQDARLAASRRLMAGRISVETCAADLRRFLHAI